jgi:hypothetical protein
MNTLLFIAWVLAVEQPLPFSHKQHAGTLGLACKQCHRQPSPGGEMTLPAEAVCASCHAEPPAAKEALRRLQGFLAARQPIPWRRVYQVPSYVFWSHGSHQNAGITCEKCHGPVATREVITPEVSHKMADCIACHRARKASTDCAHCHEPRK